MKRILLFVLMGLVLIYGSSPVLAVVGPSAYLTEHTLAHYNTDGTINPLVNYTECFDINPCRYGFVQASVPNVNDTLQYVRINLSTISGTNLNSITSYIGALSSSSVANNPSTVYVDAVWGTTDDLYYSITNTNAAPVIELSMTYSNVQGGYDLYDEDNIGPGGSSNTVEFALTATNDGTKTLNDFDITIQFEQDTSGTNDSVNVISDPPATGGTGNTDSVSRVDNDADTFYDAVDWSGDLGDSEFITITFNATIEELVNYGDATVSINLDLGTNGPVADKGTSTYYDEATSATLTGRTFSGKFTRSSIRQGVEIAQDPLTGNWTIRGLIKNMAFDIANYLTYNISGWGIYEVDPATGGIVPGAKQTGNFTPSELTPANGTITTTDLTRSSSNNWYDSGATTKPYYAASFDWEVLWDDNWQYYYGYINTTLDLPVLYKIDMDTNETRSFGVIPVETPNQIVTIEDRTKHVGSTNAPAQYIQILSVVPANTTDGDDYGNYFTINGSSVEFYINETIAANELLNDSSYAILTITQPAGGNDGLVNLTIYNLSAVDYAGGGTVGRYLSQNVASEQIILVYDVLSSGQEEAGDTFTFTGNSTMITPTGTPLTEPLPDVLIPVSAKRLTGYKDLFVPNAAFPTLVNTTIVVRVDADVYPDNITGIQFIDYVPNGTDFNRNKVSLFINETYPQILDTDFDVSLIGPITLPDGSVVIAWNYTRIGGDGTWTLYNGENITVKYQINITTTGVYVLPAIIAGFDPVTGEGFSATAYGVVRVDVPESTEPPEILIDDELSLAKRVTVGNPAQWMKSFEVFNPNTRPIQAEFETLIFSDSIEASASYFDFFGLMREEAVSFQNIDEGKKMVWKTILQPLETRKYTINVFTPPVLVIDEDVEVLGRSDEDKKVRIKKDIFLKNFAKEAYRNLAINQPIGLDSIISVKDAFGTALAFTGGSSASSVIIPEIEPLGLKTVTVIYKESYPTLIVTPDKDVYQSGKPFGMNIIIINGGEELKYSYIEFEFYKPDGSLIYADIKQLGSMKPLEKTELYETFTLQTGLPDGIYMIVARFGEDFTILASYTGNFNVAGIAPGFTGFEYVIIIAALILLFFLIRRLRFAKRRSSSVWK